MEVLEVPALKEAKEASRWGDAPPHKFDEDVLDIIAFELWQRGCCADSKDGPEPVEEDELWQHASCL